MVHIVVLNKLILLSKWWVRAGIFRLERARAVKVTSRVEPGWDTLIFDLKPSWQFWQYVHQKNANFVTHASITWFQSISNVKRYTHTNFTIGVLLLTADESSHNLCFISVGLWIASMNESWADVQCAVRVQIKNSDKYVPLRSGKRSFLIVKRWPLSWNYRVHPWSSGTTFWNIYYVHHYKGSFSAKKILCSYDKVLALGITFW